MAHVGQEMVNPVTRERFVWRATAESTGGAYCEFDLHLAPGAAVARAHAHPRQREDFRVESGNIRLRVGAAEEELEAGDERSVWPDTAHAWWNAGEGDAHVVVRLTPPGRAEPFFETFCGLGRDGRLTPKGMPRNPLQFGVWAFAYRRDFALPTPAARAAALPILAVLAAVGRLAGYRSRYPRYADGTA